MVTAGSLNLHVSLSDKIGMILESLALKKKTLSLDFGCITFHDYLDWRENPSKKKTWDHYESVTDLPSSDFFQYFDGLKI